MTADKFRMLALALAGAVESEHMSHPDFRVGGKVFASLGYPDGTWGMVKLTPEQQRAFVKQAPQTFKPCNGAWGVRGCTNVHLESAKMQDAKAAVQMAFQNVVDKAGLKTGSMRPVKQKRARSKVRV
jgi:hypothetical protein